MSAGFAIAMQAVPFFQLLDREVAAVAAAPMAPTVAVEWNPSM